MAERLRLELEESKAEIARLRDRLAIGMPPIHKDLSLISLIPKWSGAETAAPLEEFFASIEGAAKMGRWTQEDCVQLATLRLLDPARAFYNANLDLHATEVTWESFKAAFRERFRDVRPDQFYFSKLQTAKQGKNEDPQEFADRCRGLAQKVMGRDRDPTVQRIHRENAERMCLASFVGGLQGMVGRHTRIANPQSMQQALTVALAATEALKQEKGNEIFRVEAPKERSVHNSHADSRRDRFSKGTKMEPKNGAEIRCYECDGRGHYARECPTRSRRESKPRDPPRNKDPTRRPWQPNRTRNKSESTRDPDARKGTSDQGNE